MNNFLIGLISSIFILVGFLLIEFMTRKKNLPKEITRKFLHIISGLFGILMGMILDKWVFITLAMAFIAIITISYAFKFFTSIHGVKRKTYGEILLPIGILLAFLISGGWNTIYMASVLILAFADPAAGLVGNLRTVKYKWVGSFVFFITSLIILVGILHDQPFYHLVLIALIVTIIEKFSPYGTDNLTVPIIASLLLRLSL